MVPVSFRFTHLVFPGIGTLNTAKYAYIDDAKIYQNHRDLECIRSEKSNFERHAKESILITIISLI